MPKQVGALWDVRNSENPDFVYSGVIETLNGDVKIGVFKNSKKEEGDKQPSFHLVKMEDQES